MLIVLPFGLSHGLVEVRERVVYRDGPFLFAKILSHM